jgi:hypothetical protein
MEIDGALPSDINAVTIAMVKDAKRSEKKRPVLDPVTSTKQVTFSRP